MLTGDHHQVAKTIASDLGMTHFLTEILPDQKAAEIQKLQNQGKRVAVETAQITLMSGDIRDCLAGCAYGLGLALLTAAFLCPHC